MTREDLAEMYADGKRDFSNISSTGIDVSNLDLRDCDFSGANMDNFYAGGANLSNAKFVGAELSQSGFDDADLTEADFSGAILRSCGFQRANLKGANLSETSLPNSSFTKAILEETDFSGAIFRYTRMPDGDLRSSDDTPTAIAKRKPPAKATAVTKTTKRQQDVLTASWQKYIRPEVKKESILDAVRVTLETQPNKEFNIAEVMDALFKEDMPKHQYLKARNRIANVLSEGVQAGDWCKGARGTYRITAA